MGKVPRGEGYSLLWRLGWRFEYVLMHIYGAASLDDARDPKVQMRRDRERRKRLHDARKAARQHKR
jgi:hypothetical protein